MFVIVPEVAIKSKCIILFSWGAAVSFNLLVNGNDDYLFQKRTSLPSERMVRIIPNLLFVWQEYVCFMYVDWKILFVINLT